MSKTSLEKYPWQLRSPLVATGPKLCTLTPISKYDPEFGVPVCDVALRSRFVKKPVLFTMKGLPLPCPMATRTAHGRSSCPAATMHTILVARRAEAPCGGASAPSASTSALKCLDISATSGGIARASPPASLSASRVLSVMRATTQMCCPGPSGPFLRSYFPNTGLSGG